MTTVTSLFRLASRTFWTALSLPIIALYILVLLFFTLHDPQRFLLYLHPIHSGYLASSSPRDPENFRSLKIETAPALDAHRRACRPPPYSNYVVPFTITTPDNERLFAWFMWLSVPWRSDDEKSSFHSQLHRLLGVPLKSRAYYATLEREDPPLLQRLRKTNAKVIIYFHGNAGHVAESMRIKFYNALLANCASDTPAFLIVPDYRGFGHSSGKPTEHGLIVDGISTVAFVLERLKMPARNIVLASHSLGTAVATAVYEHFELHDDGQNELGGLVLASGFTSVPELLLEYRLGGCLPILGPLKAVPALLGWFQGKIVDMWETGKRLRRIVAGGKAWKVLIVHSRNDWEIPTRQSETLFKLGMEGLLGEDCKEWPTVTIETEAGVMKKRCDAGSQRQFELLLLPEGGHDGSIYQRQTVEAIFNMGPSADRRCDNCDNSR